MLHFPLKIIPMELLNLHKILSFLLQFCHLLLLSSAYTPPEIYFINCGSDSNVTVFRRNFIGDVNSDLYSFSPGKKSRVLEDTNSSPSSTLSLYQTARIYTNPSSYKFHNVDNGTYILRLHFSLFSSTTNLSNAVFDVSASESLLLSNFSLRNATNSPEIKEFLLNLDSGEFKIDIIPSAETSLAFVNAIEFFLTPPDFLPDTAPLVTHAGTKSDYGGGLLSRVLHPVHRINVGGDKLTADNDTLWRSWITDDDYLYNEETAKKSEPYSERPKYSNAGCTQYTAPDLVYRTAKELNVNSSRLTKFFNITWSFGVSKNVEHLVRVHFCDIISPAINFLNFSLYIYNYSEKIDPHDKAGYLATPFYIDYIVESDDSGVINLAIGPRNDSDNQNAFLNGVEIMELMGETGSGLDGESSKKSLLIIVGLVVGGVGLIFSLIGLLVLLWWFKCCRKAKPVEDSVWRYQDPSSYSRMTDGTVNASPLPNMNLGLKIPYSEILYATKNFNKKLMIGEGGFGKVYKGTFRSGENVAVKRSEPGHGQGRPEFQTEIMVLSRIRHRHLVSLIGYCDDDERSEMILVYEFMEKGTLREHLYGNADNSSSRSELSWKQRLEICIGSARGLHYLHTGTVGGIIHRDVKSTNILLDENYVAKVADFGLSKSGPLDQNETPVSTGVKGSFGYLDPEYFRCLQLTDKSDVYSFGVVLLEVLCARPAINNSLPREQVNLAEWGMFWQTKGQLEKIVDPFLVGDINPNSLRKFGETAEKCLKDNGTERPTMGDVLWDLEYALQLQKTAVLREPHEDSTTDASIELPLRSVQRFPSHSYPIEGDDVSMSTIQDDGSETTASEVFSQLRIDDAR